MKYQCPFCDNQHSTQQFVIAHMVHMHRKALLDGKWTRSIVCPICKLKIKNEARQLHPGSLERLLKRHMNEYGGIRTHEYNTLLGIKP